MIDWLMDPGNFMTRNCCGTWSPWMEGCYRIGSMLSSVAYFAISITLFITWMQKRSILPKPGIVIMFSVVFFFCGASHAGDWLSFIYPAYRLFSVIAAFNGLVAIIGAILLPLVIVYVLRLPTPAQLASALKHSNDSSERLRLTQAGERDRTIALFRKLAKIQDKIAVFEKLPGMHEAVVGIRADMNSLIADCKSGDGTSP